MPKLAHLPLILNPDGNGKISKREARFPVFPLSWKDPREATPYIGYKETGYYPEAFVNILALLGWNPGTNEEIFSLDELAKIFDFDRVHKSGAKFDPEKAKWFNQQYLRKKSDAELAEAFKPVLKEKGIAKEDNFIMEFCKLLKEKVQFTHEFWEQGKYIFESPAAYDEKVIAKKWNETNKDLFTKLLLRFESLTTWDAQFLHDDFAIAQNEIGKLDMQVLRVLITGVAGGPQLFDLLALIGKDETIARFKTALTKL